jgi:hypothetical protein
MTHKGNFANISAWKEPRRVILCLDQANICRMPRKASLASKTCPNQKSSNEAGIIDGRRAHFVNTVPIETARPNGYCMIWGIWFRVVRMTSISRILCTTARNVINILMPTCPTWPCRDHIIPTAWLPWPSAWWSRTACHIKRPVGISGETIGFSCPSPPSRTGWKPGEKKAEARIEADYLDWALADFSGYIAADELYDGPYCVLSIVDNRTFKRIFYRVLDHDPAHDDIREFFRAFHTALEARGLALQGITTDGSPLYPQPLVEIFPGVRHQVCEFHVLAEITKAVLRAVSRVRKELTRKKEKMGRGRPGSKQAKRATRRNRRLQRKIGDLFAYRHLFVAHHLTKAQCKILKRIARGLPQLHALRQIMDEVYRLFDRRCRTDTALAKLAKLRARVRRFQQVGKTLGKLFTPNLEKALTFLDDKQLPATSNAVERGNRRHRKMQKTIYRVRTQQHIHARIAIDMLREARARGRFDTTQSLHYARAG